MPWDSLPSAAWNAAVLPLADALALRMERRYPLRHALGPSTECRMECGGPAAGLRACDSEWSAAMPGNESIRYSPVGFIWPGRGTIGSTEEEEGVGLGYLGHPCLRARQGARVAR